MAGGLLEALGGKLWSRTVRITIVAAIAVTGGLSNPAVAETRQSAIRVLNSLPVSVERPIGYDRDLFRHWSDLDSDGCDTREQVLIDERVSGQLSGCEVTGGEWRSAYDGDVTNNPSSFDIDHMVPLKEAWDSGAWRWNASTRERFANDLGYAGALIAVSASSNRSKSDRDPAEWLPERGRCKYAKTWVAIKFRWRLAVDTTEKSELTRILNSCSPEMRVPSIARITTE